MKELTFSPRGEFGKHSKQYPFILEWQNFRKPPNRRQIPQDVSGLSQLAGDVRAALFAPLIAGFGSAGQSCPRV